MSLAALACLALAGLASGPEQAARAARAADFTRSVTGSGWRSYWIAGPLWTFEMGYRDAVGTPPRRTGDGGDWSTTELESAGFWPSPRLVRSPRSEALPRYAAYEQLMAGWPLRWIARVRERTPSVEESRQMASFREVFNAEATAWDRLADARSARWWRIWWPGLLGNVALCALIAGGAAAVSRLAGRRQARGAGERWSRGACHACGYRVHHLPRCPECGATDPRGPVNAGAAD